jgi:hypothetical protein
MGAYPPQKLSSSGAVEGSVSITSGSAVLTFTKNLTESVNDVSQFGYPDQASVYSYGTLDFHTTAAARYNLSQTTTSYFQKLLMAVIVPTPPVIGVEHLRRSSRIAPRSLRFRTPGHTAQ